MWQTIKSGRTWHGEFLNRKKNGDLYWADVVIAPVIDEDRQIISFLAVQVDITQRKLAEDALRDANRMLESQLREIEGLQSSLREQALRDPLTQLHNRRFLSESLEHEFHRAQRTSEPLSVIMLDLDLFKSINDTYGHAAGDACLVWLARLLQQHIRRSDILCRYGGEEFLLVLPATDMAGATHYAERLRLLVERETCTVDRHHLQLTVSLGIACYPSHGATGDEIIDRADEAMYVSKRAGRNRVTAWSPAEKI
jgi:diguanylate cyclase (GGDEF)-like protein